MVSRPIDQHALDIPRKSGLRPCLWIPVAARNIEAIERYVGRVVTGVAAADPSRAILVEAHEPEKPDTRLAIWSLPESAILQFPRQVWVHVDYQSYRRAYLRAFPDADLSGLVLDHVMNRRVARLKGFQYLRIVPISREANSSHGGLSEIWSFEHHSSSVMRKKNGESLASVQYADLADIVKMLNRQGGGSVMANVNDAQRLVDLPGAG